MSLPIALYRGVAMAAFAFASPWLCRRYAGHGLEERRGRYASSLIQMLRRKGRPLWVHAVSVGEVQSASPFLRRAAACTQRPLILSCTTATGKEMASQLLDGVVDQVLSAPWDSPLVVHRASTSIRPKAYVTVETEIWPGILWEMRRQGTPSFMINGRFSDRSFTAMARCPWFWRDVLSLYTILMVRADSDREKLIGVGLPSDRVIVTGDCKADALRERKDLLDQAPLKELLGAERPIVLAGSTHRGEDEIVLLAFRMVLARYPGARLILVPRHPERADEVAALATSLGPVALYSRPSPGWRVLVVDRIGVLFGLYSQADCAFIGGSLVPRGGQNIMEPALFGVPFCQGPQYQDFIEATQALNQAGVGTVIVDGDTMGRAFLRDLEAGRRDRVARAAKAYFEGLPSAADRSWETISSFLV